MSTDVLTHGGFDISKPGRHAQFPGLDLETALARFLRGVGELHWDNDQADHLGLLVELLLYEGADPNIWAERLAHFLADWGVPDGTVVSFITHPPKGELQ